MLSRAWSRIRNEPAVVAGVVIAALNAATVQTWEGYMSAVVAALVRFVVSPVDSSQPA